jgi:hypothetical protein
MMTLAIAVVVVAALAFGKDVFIPIVLAVLLSFVLAPFVDLLRPPAPASSTRRDRGRGSWRSASSSGWPGSSGCRSAELANDLPQYRTTVQQQGLRR